MCRCWAGCCAGGGCPRRQVRPARGRQSHAALRTLPTPAISVVFFPKAPGRPTGQVLPFNEGPFQLAIIEQVPISPLAVEGSGAALPRDTWIFGEYSGYPPADTGARPRRRLEYQTSPRAARCRPPENRGRVSPTACSLNIDCDNVRRLPIYSEDNVRLPAPAQAENHAGIHLVQAGVVRRGARVQDGYADAVDGHRHICQ